MPDDRGVRAVDSFQWAPRFNFVVDGKAVEDDEDVVAIAKRYTSHELSAWHQDQAVRLEKIHKLTSGSSRRNTATVMLSLIYRQGKNLRIRNVQIPHIFVSGCGMPGRLRDCIPAPHCIHNMEVYLHLEPLISEICSSCFHQALLICR